MIEKCARCGKILKAREIFELTIVQRTGESAMGMLICADCKQFILDW